VKKRYEIYLPGGDIIQCYRTWWDWLWFDNPFSAFVRFRLDDGNVVNVSKHFTIKMVELK
jgi:hypothetical protein